MTCVAHYLNDQGMWDGYVTYQHSFNIQMNLCGFVQEYMILLVSRNYILSSILVCQLLCNGTRASTHQVVRGTRKPPSHHTHELIVTHIPPISSIYSKGPTIRWWLPQQTNFFVDSALEPCLHRPSQSPSPSPSQS